MSHSTQAASRQQRRLRPDVFTIFVMAVLAAAGVIVITATQLVSTFTPEGIVWRLPVAEAPVTAAGFSVYGSDGPRAGDPVTGTLTAINVLVTDLNTVSASALGAMQVAAGVTGLCAIVCTAGIAWLFLRGAFFSRATGVLVRTLTIGLVIGAATSYACWRLAANGVEAALGVQAERATGPLWWAWYAVILFVVCSLGLLDIALARARRMQEEVEGLV